MTPGTRTSNPSRRYSMTMKSSHFGWKTSIGTKIFGSLSSCQRIVNGENRPKSLSPSMATTMSFRYTRSGCFSPRRMCLSLHKSTSDERKNDALADRMPAVEVAMARRLEDGIHARQGSSKSTCPSMTLSKYSLRTRSKDLVCS